MQTAQRRGRYGHRDATMILVAYRHGLRVAELCALRWDQVDLKQGLLHVQRLKQGLPSVHPLRGPELRALRRVQRDMPSSSYVFTTERGSPMTRAGFRKMLARIGDASTLAFPVHPHMPASQEQAPDNATCAIIRLIAHPGLCNVCCFRAAVPG